MKIIDPHIHLFDITLGEYAWLKPDNPPYWPDKAKINRNFGQRDLLLPPNMELAGLVHIEAGFNNQHPWLEIEWLDSSCSLPHRTVACIDLTSDQQDFNKTLDKLAKHKSVVGVRHILDEDAFAILQHPNTSQNLTTLAEKNLIFELQMPFLHTESVEQFTHVLHKVSGLTVIINHSGIPPYSSAQECLDWRAWQDNLAKLSAFKQVALKCSGAEMINRNYELTWLKNTLLALVELFGIDRVMLASNFPLCLFSKTYQQHWLDNFEIGEIAANNLLFQNAYNWYRFKEIS